MRRPGFRAAEVEAWQSPEQEPVRRESLFMRFANSMVIDFDKWRNRVGYDLDALRIASPTEKDSIERMLIRLGVNDWRDVEALAMFKTPRSEAALLTAMRNPSLRDAVLYFAPELAAKDKLN